MSASDATWRRQGVAADMLRGAAALVEGQRAGTHGHAQVQFAMVAQLWTVMLGRPIMPEQVALMLQQVKIARAMCGDHKHADHYVDMAGYAAIAYELAKARP